MTSATAPTGMDGRAAARCASAPRRRCIGRYNIIILSDRMVGPDRIPIPALLATAAVHHHLIRKGLRTSVGLVVETGEAREVHHFACLAGYGAEAINPYLAFETLAAMAKDLPEEVERLRGGQALHQVDRQGPAQGHVEDGHLDLPVLLRRADLRRHRPVARRSSTAFFFGTATTHRRRRASARSPRRRRAATPTRSANRRCCAARSRSAANTPTACAARRIAGRRRRCRCCSTRCAATRATSTTPTPSCSTSRTNTC